MTALQARALRGSTTPLITPFRDVDYDTYASLGACGLMNAVGNLVPGPVARLYETVASGDLDAGRRAHFELLELNRAVFWDTNPIPIKYMAKRLGIIPTNEHRLPMVPATPDLERRLDDLLRSMALLEQ